jgi:hypothetical protein
MNGKSGSIRSERKNLKVICRRVISNAVAANTFRAFKCHRGHKPSVTFRDWANRVLDTNTLENLWVVKSQSEYDEWLLKLVKNFMRYWNSTMAKVAYGPYFKLPNLLAKRLCLYRDVRQEEFNRVVWFLHVPLDSYTIVAVKKCVAFFPHQNAIGRIPNTATMSFVKNQKMYDAFQTGIRKMACDAGVPPVALDCLAWDKSH